MQVLKLLTLRNLLLLCVAYLVWKHIVSDFVDVNYSLPFLGSGTIENYGDPHLHYGCWSGHELEGCEPGHTATQECHEFAQATCGTTNDRLNNCWLPAFRKCSASAPNSLAKTNCHKYANAYCGGNPGECAECFSKTHQLCMAQKGMGADPSCTTN